MKVINRTPFNSIFYVCVFITLLFVIVFVFREIDNILLFLVIYIILISIYIISKVGDVNDIMYNDSKVEITNSVTGKVNEFFYKNLNTVEVTMVTAAGDQIVINSKDGNKSYFGYIGIHPDDINEMMDFINKKIKENKI